MIRAGIVGAGLMGRWHAHSIHRAGGRVVAIADLDLGAAERLAAGYHHALSFADHEQMLDKVGLDVLHICTPLSTHLGIAESTIEASRHLVIEKPLARCAAETEYLYNRAEEYGVLICPVHQFLFQDGVLEALQWLPRIGKLVHIGATFCSAGGVGVDGERLDQIVADILPHPLSLLQLFLANGFRGENLWSIRPNRGELRSHGVISGVSISLFISMSARPTQSSFLIAGTEGTIHIDLYHGYAFLQPGAVSRAQKILQPFDVTLRRFAAATLNLTKRAIYWEPAYPGLRRLITHFYQTLRSDTEPPIAPGEAIAVARAREHILQSFNIIVSS